MEGWVEVVVTVVTVAAVRVVAQRAVVRVRVEGVERVEAEVEGEDLEEEQPN